ncbi:MAG: hypothetical protein WC169_12480 [Dehalococcoidia bacterium]|jgi:hypothetical protein
MKFIVEAYNLETKFYFFFYEDIKTDRVEIEVIANDELEAEGKVRKIISRRNYFKVIKVIV